MSSLFEGVEWPPLPLPPPTPVATSSLGWNKKPTTPEKPSICLYTFSRRYQAKKKVVQEMEAVFDILLCGYDILKCEAGDILNHFATFINVFSEFDIKTTPNVETINRLLYFYQQYAKALQDQDRISSACFVFCVTMANSLREYGDEGKGLVKVSDLPRMLKYHATLIPEEYKSTREYEDYKFDLQAVNVVI